MIMDQQTHKFANCPTCRGLCLVLPSEPSEAYQEWAHRVSCQHMIEFLESEGLAHQVTVQERRYAYGEAA